MEEYIKRSWNIKDLEKLYKLTEIENNEYYKFKMFQEGDKVYAFSHKKSLLGAFGVVLVRKGQIIEIRAVGKME